MSEVRVRFPPSPTGIPHIGNTRTALFNYLFARHNKGVFILRIEDTDQKRIVPGAREAIEEILNWLGIAADEVSIQSERLPLYQEASQNLLRHNFARKEEGAIRFIVPKGRSITWEDAVGRKKISFRTDDIEDFIILKSDDFPTYHLANVVDDYEMKITHVIRGDEWISSTPKHILLYEAFGWEPPIFAHLPVILGPDKTKLSKRHGAKSVLEFRNEGYLKEALLNFMALLGWTHPKQKDVFSIGEAIKAFDLKDVNTNSPIFDINKLTWLNGYYIRKAQSANLKAQIIEQDPKIAHVDRNLLDKLIPLAQTRMKTLKDFYELAKPVLEEAQVKLGEKEKAVAKRLIQEFSTIEQWNNQAILATFRDVITHYNLRMSVLYKICTGRESGLPLPETLEILGREKTLKRLERVFV